MQSSAFQIGFRRGGYTVPFDLQDVDDSESCRWCLMMDCPSLTSGKIVCAQNPNGEDGFFRRVREELDARHLCIDLDNPGVHSRIRLWYDLDFTPDQVIEYLWDQFEDHIDYDSYYDYV